MIQIAKKSYFLHTKYNFSSVEIVFQVLMVFGALLMVSSSDGKIVCPCFEFNNQSKSWGESEMYCQQNEGHLVSMETQDEWNVINLAIQNRISENNEWYTGLYNNYGINWRWVSNHNLTYDRWQGRGPLDGGKNCVVLAKNHSSDQKGFLRNVNCSFPKDFICEYNREHGDFNDCDVLEPKYCWNSTNNPRASPSTSQTTITKPSISNQIPDLIFVVIALGILLASGFGCYIYLFYCKKNNTKHTRTRVEWKFKYQAPTQSEVISIPSQDELFTENSFQDDISQEDREISPEPQEPTQVTVEHSADENPDSLSTDQSPEPTSAALYSSVEIEQVEPKEEKDASTPRIPRPYNEEEPVAPTQPEVTSIPSQAELFTENSFQEDSSQQDRKISPDPQEPTQVTMEHSADEDPDSLSTDQSPEPTCAALYSNVEVEQKKPEEKENAPAPRIPRAYHKASPVVYAKVDKSKKKKAGKGKAEIVYAKVDKSKKKKKENP